MTTSYSLFSSTGLKKIKKIILVSMLALICSTASAQLSGKYTFSAVNTGSYAPVASGTTLQSGSGGATDAVFTSIAIGFSFQFNCQTYTTLGISNNGFIWFGTGTCSATQYTPLSSQVGEVGAVDGIIAAYGQNLINSTTNAANTYLRYLSTGVAPNRTFTVEWRKMTQSGVANQPCDHQIILNETTNTININHFDNSYGLAGTSTGQVGMRSNSTADFVNRKPGTSNWCATVAGTLNTDNEVITAVNTCNWASNGASKIGFIYTFTGSCCTPPTTQATNMTFSSLTTSSVQVNWTNGNGAARIVVAHVTTAVSASPANGTDYTAGANSVFGSGTNLGSNNYIVYQGTGSSVNVTNLTGGNTYCFAVFDYATSPSICYLTPGLSNCQSIPACTSYPTTDATSLVFSNITNTAVDLSFTRGNGSNVMVVARLTATTRVPPTFNTSYTANTVFGSGNTTGAGNYVVLNGTANAATVTGLANLTAYTFDVYEYNASPNCYSPSPLIASVTTLDGTTSGGCAATVVRTATTMTAVAPTTTLQTANTTNTNYTNQSIGFNFVYNGITYTNFGLNTNGYIWFTQNSGAPLASTTNPISNASPNLGGSGTIDGVISAMGAFINSNNVLATQRSIGYTVTGVAPNRVLTIQWLGYTATNAFGICASFGYPDNNRQDFQIKLNEDGGTASDQIVLAYGDESPYCVDAASSAQVGIRGTSNASFTNRTGAAVNWGANAGVNNTDVCTTGASSWIHGATITFTQAVTTGPTVNGFTSGGTASNACPAVTVALTAGSGFTSYQWFLNGSIIPGPGSNSSTYTATASGSYTVVGKNGTCYAQSNAFVVTINSCGVAPTITCPSNVNQANDAGQCGAVVNYAAATATGVPAPAITYSQNAGTSFPVGTTTVTATATNASGSANCTFTVTVTDNESPVIGSCPLDITQCDNHVANFSTPTATDNCSATVACVPASGSTFATGATTVTCTATDPANHTSSCSFTVTINESPVIAACPSNITQCDNHVAIWTDPTATGTPTPSVACVPASGSTFATGTTTITCTATNSCGSDACTFTVTINESPLIGTCPSDITQCDNHVAMWTDPTATGTPAPSVVCSPASGSTFATGTTSVICTASNTCGISQCTFSVTINETPVIAACPSDITTCNPVVTYSSPSATGTPVASVVCSPASGSTFAVGTTVVTCTATNSCGSSSCSFNVNIQSSSVAASGATSNAANNEICLGSNVTLSETGGSLGVGADWVWYEGGCGSGASIGSGVSITITPSVSGAHTYFVRAQGTCNTTACSSISINVKTVPPAGTVHITSAPTDGCVGGSATVSVNTVSTATFYRWTCTTGGVLFNGQPSPYDSPSPSVTISYVALPTNSSGWSICVFPGNACGSSNTICTWIRATVSKPSTITGSVNGCPSTSSTYSTPSVPGVASYIWSVTGNATITGNGNSTITVNFSAGFTSGTLCVHAQTICGYNSADQCMSLNNTTAVPGVITGPGYVCPNANSTFTITAVPGAASYNWSTTVTGAIITNNGTSCTIAFPSTILAGSLVCVTSLSPCGNQSASRCKGIATGLPNTPANISGPTGGQCAATGVSYFISPVSGATGYSWTANNGATISGPNNLSGVSIDFPASFNTVTLSVMAVNTCGSGGIRTLVVSGAPATPVSISGNNAVCYGTGEQYIASGSAGATAFTWTVPANASILGGQGSANIVVLWGATSGNITVKASNACGLSGTRTYAVSVVCREGQILNTVEAIHAEVFPNPTDGKANIKFNSISSEKLLLNVTDITGRILMNENVTAIEGVNLHELDLSPFAKGVYMIELKGKEQDEVLRITVE